MCKIIVSCKYLIFLILKNNIRNMAAYMVTLLATIATDLVVTMRP